MSVRNFITWGNNKLRLVSAIVASGGAADANKIVATNSAGVIDPSMMPPGVEITTVSVVSTDALPARSLINIYNNAGTRNARLADASNGRQAHGFVLAAVAANVAATVYESGTITGFAGLIPGDPAFLSAATAGTPTPTAPTAIGHGIQQIGYNQSATEIFFEFSPMIEIATLP